MELNRRTFLAVLAPTTTALAVRKHQTRKKAVATQSAEPLHFFSDSSHEPYARPRTSAIIYVGTEV